VEQQEQNGIFSNGHSPNGSIQNGAPQNGAVQNGHSPEAVPANGHSPVPTELDRASNGNGAQKPKLHHIGKARKRQGLSVRCVAQRLNKTVGEVREQEDERADILLSELYRWQKVLEVPLEELLREPQDALSPRVRLRAQMLRIMKTARALRSQARSQSESRLAGVLISQLIEIMPELKEVAAWPTVGHRRTADELGRIAEHPVPDDWMYEAS
jgi:transcriptional regulator with XRE-family HTH domain